MRVLKLLVPSLILFTFCFSNSSAQENKKNGDVYFMVEEMPEYPGGDEQLRKDLASSVKYPAEAKKDGKQGKVYVSFVLNEEGKITKPKVVRGVCPLLDKEALRAVNSLNKIWVPGKEKGVAVKVAYTVPIKFALNGDKPKEGSKTAVKNGEDGVFAIVEEMPKYPGGHNQLKMDIANSVKYPEEAKKAKKQGKVFVSFIVNEDGKITNSKIERGVCPSLDKEALRVVNGLDKTWTPAKEKGKKVKVRFTVPINFALS